MEASYIKFKILFLFIILFTSTYAQDEFDFKQWFVEAESYFLFEEYEDALPLYQRLLREEPDNYNVYFKIGICYLNNPYQKEKSIQYLSKASEHISTDYRTNSYKERFAPPETNYYLGQAYRVNGNLNKAIEYYSLFKKNLDPNVFDISIVNEEINSCQVARKMLKSPVYVKSENSGDLINSRFEEINPVISGDGNTMVFTRKLQFYDAVFIVRKDKNGNWLPPYNLTPDFGLDGNSYCTGISSSGDEILVYRSDNFDGNIYSSRLVNGKWQKLQKLNENINTKYWESHASFSPDGKFLFFSSNRKGGYGGLDIYKAPRIAGGEWGVPVNLGPIVNSPYNEDTPFISTTDNKLYFSSLGHDGMGGYDIFVSELIGPETWSNPVNMGYPVNSTDDDLFFCPDPDEDITGLYSLYDPQSSFGLKDIYYVKVYNSVLPRMFSLSGQVNVPVPDILSGGNVKITIIDNEAGKIVQQVTADSLGMYSLNVPQGEYQLLVDGKGIKPVSLPLRFSVTQEDDDIDVPLITAQLAAIGEDELLVTPSAVPEIELVGPEFFITDTTPATINLKVDKGDDLIVEHFVGNKLITKKEYLLTKDDFAYVFTPESGVNRLVFTIRDNKGNTNQQEVKVVYKPKQIEESIVEKEKTKPKSIKTNELAGIASKNLKIYLDSLGSFEYTSLSDLYSILIENAKENNFTEQEIEDLFSIILTQQVKDSFVKSLTNQNNEFTRELNDSILKNSEFPISLINNLRTQGKVNMNDLNSDLMSISDINKSGSNLPEYIISFAPKDITTENDLLDIEDNAVLFKKITGMFKTQEAENMIDKAATTRVLKQFYLNLLLSADSDLRAILTDLNLDSLNIDNSIDLVKYLFIQAENGKIDKLSLIQQIEKANINERENIILFKEALANEAAGELKLSIQEYNPLESSSPEILDMLDDLLKNSITKGYGRTQVYDLLVNMIGISNVNEFIDKMKKHTSGDLDSLLFSVDKNKFSVPLEVIQYLLSEAPYFDFTESDINNLLIRMLLENGIEGHEISKDSSYSKFLFNKNRFTYTIVLINIIIVLLIILLWRKRRKNKQH